MDFKNIMIIINKNKHIKKIKTLSDPFGNKTEMKWFGYCGELKNYKVRDFENGDLVLG